MEKTDFFRSLLWLQELNHDDKVNLHGTMERRLLLTDANCNFVGTTGGKSYDVLLRYNGASVGSTQNPFSFAMSVFMPNQKTEAVSSLQQRYPTLCFVIDGREYIVDHPRIMSLSVPKGTSQERSLQQQQQQPAAPSTTATVSATAAGVAAVPATATAPSSAISAAAPAPAPAPASSVLPARPAQTTVIVSFRHVKMRVWSKKNDVQGLADAFVLLNTLLKRELTPLTIVAPRSRKRSRLSSECTRLSSESASSASSASSSSSQTVVADSSASVDIHQFIEKQTESVFSFIDLAYDLRRQSQGEDGRGVSAGSTSTITANTTTSTASSADVKTTGRRGRVPNAMLFRLDGAAVKRYADLFDRSLMHTDDFDHVNAELSARRTVNESHLCALLDEVYNTADAGRPKWVSPLP